MNYYIKNLPEIIKHVSTLEVGVANYTKKEPATDACYTPCLGSPNWFFQIGVFILPISI